MSPSPHLYSVKSVKLKFEDPTPPCLLFAKVFSLDKSEFLLYYIKWEGNQHHRCPKISVKLVISKKLFRMTRLFFLAAVLAFFHADISLGSWSTPRPVAMTSTDDWAVAATVDDFNRIWTVWYQEEDVGWPNYISVVASYFAEGEWVAPMEILPPSESYGCREYLHPGIANAWSKIWVTFGEAPVPVKGEKQEFFGLNVSYYDCGWSEPFTIDWTGGDWVPLAFSDETNKLFVGYDVWGHSGCPYCNVDLVSCINDTWSTLGTIVGGYCWPGYDTWESNFTHSLAIYDSLVWIAYEYSGCSGGSHYEGGSIVSYDIEDSNVTYYYEIGGMEPDIAADSLGNIWFAFVDTGISIYYRDTSGVWHEDYSITSGGSPSITIDTADQIWIAWSDGAGIYVSHRDSIGWEIPEYISFGIRPETVSDDSGHIWVLWERQGNIYFSTTRQILDPDIIVSDTSHDFGGVSIGDSLDWTFIIENVGDTNLVVGSIVLDNLQFCLVSPSFPQTIIPFDSVEVTTRFKPSTPGIQHCTLTIHSNDPDEGALYIKLKGGIGPEIVLSDTFHYFGNVIVDSSREWSFIIKNRGNINLVIDSLHSTQPVFGVVSPGFPQIVVPDDSMGVTLQFTPQDTGVISGSISIYSSDPINPICNIHLLGRGIMPDIKLSDTLHDFGDVFLGDSAYWHLFIKNRGNADLIADSLVLDNVVFEIVSPLFPDTITPFDSIDVYIRFAPQDTGTEEGLIKVYSNDPDEPLLQVRVLGCGTLGVEEIELKPTVFSMMQNIPNPFVNKTVIKYQLPTDCHVMVKIYDFAGRCVRQLLNANKPSGYYKIIWDGRDNRGKKLPAGIYFCRLEARKFTTTRRLTMLR
ncbi:hypothetical protein CH333_03575 [candidate division WOR-3 bacterium JGI_Cruoil_03_44_89]|uniref:Uncharacterized protein n=1 Tax=candidate division WOR-3 bacterium JGI_Cruoil_03_44_89 TaxID=1973748 RepID=A0A235BVY1_UNCW3|nr:MAG: hypothetical protein CH333_03575 [candidate division WOR-3 bacterium JGI_Cruoil_03_44_89]